MPDLVNTGRRPWQYAGVTFPPGVAVSVTDEEAEELVAASGGRLVENAPPDKPARKSPRSPY